MYVVARHGILYQDSRFMAAFPSLVRTAHGDILLIFRRAPDARWLLGAVYDERRLSDTSLRDRLYHWDARSSLVALRFDPETEKCSQPTALDTDALSADQDASLLRLESGTLLLASFSWYAMPPAFASLAGSWGGRAYGGPANTGCSFIEWGSYVRSSQDGGATWSERCYLPAIPGAAPLVPGLRPSHGGCVRGQAVERLGEILLPTYCAIDGMQSAHILVSADEGVSWSYRGVIAKSAEINFYEPSLTLCDDGSVVAWLRTNDRDDRIASARSTDGGWTWSPYKLHGAVGHPAHGLRLASGAILLTYGFRHKPYGLRARLLNARGDNIDEAQELVLRDDGINTDLGYPWAIECEDGRVLVAYYLSTTSGVRHIAYSVLEPD